MGGHTLEVEAAVCALQKHPSNWYFVLEANFNTTNPFRSARSREHEKPVKKSVRRILKTVTRPQKTVKLLLLTHQRTLVIAASCSHHSPEMLPVNRALNRNDSVHHHFGSLWYIGIYKGKKRDKCYYGVLWHLLACRCLPNLQL